MIDKSYGSYNLSCDVCGEVVDEPLDDFYDAVNYKKAKGWKSRKIKGEWLDVCPDCQGAPDV